MWGGFIGAMEGTTPPALSTMGLLIGIGSPTVELKEERKEMREKEGSEG